MLKQLPFFIMLKSLIEKLSGKKSSEAIGLEESIAYTFTNRDHLNLALIHCSMAKEKEEQVVKYNNERMEFLGDSILNFLVTDHLYKSYPELTEGEMSKMKSVIVSTRVLARCALKIELGKYVVMSNSEDKAGGRNRESILADAFEALLAALYLDSGISQCSKLLTQVLFPEIGAVMADDKLKNYKSILLELSQGNGMGAPTYTVISEEGPEHEKLFKVEAMVNGESVGGGTGHSKKRAEQEAAREALKTIQKKIEEESNS